MSNPSQLIVRPAVVVSGGTGGNGGVTLAAGVGTGVTAESFGAKGDGHTDDTLALTAALATGKTVLLGPKTYCITTLALGNSASLQGCTNCVLKCTLPIAGNGNAYALTLTNCSRVVLRDIHLIAANPAPTSLAAGAVPPLDAPGYPNGMLLSGAYSCILSNVQIDGFNRGVHLTSNSGDTQIMGGSYFHSCRTGITFESVINYVSGCTFAGCLRGCVATGYGGLVVSNSTFTGGVASGYAYAHFSSFASCEEIWVTNCWLENGRYCAKTEGAGPVSLEFRGCRLNCDMEGLSDPTGAAILDVAGVPGLLIDGGIMSCTPGFSGRLIGDAQTAGRVSGLSCISGTRVNQFAGAVIVTP